jgi:hypothetical protein
VIHGSRSRQRHLPHPVSASTPSSPVQTLLPPLMIPAPRRSIHQHTASTKLSAIAIESERRAARDWSRGIVIPRRHFAGAVGGLAGRHFGHRRQVQWHPCDGRIVEFSDAVHMSEGGLRSKTGCMGTWSLMDAGCVKTTDDHTIHIVTLESYTGRSGVLDASTAFIHPLACSRQSLPDGLRRTQLPPRTHASCSFTTGPSAPPGPVPASSPLH